MGASRKAQSLKVPGWQKTVSLLSMSEPPTHGERMPGAQLTASIAGLTAAGGLGRGLHGGSHCPGIEFGKQEMRVLKGCLKVCEYETASET